MLIKENIYYYIGFDVINENICVWVYKWVFLKLYKVVISILFDVFYYKRKYFLIF